MILPKGTLAQVVAERDSLHALASDLNLRVGELHDDVKVIMKELKATRGDMRQAHNRDRKVDEERFKLRAELAVAKETMSQAKADYQHLLGKAAKADELLGRLQADLAQTQ